MELKFSYSKYVDYVRYHSDVSGIDAPISTLKWDVYGTDLGIPVFSEKENKLWFFFGDTFSTPLPSDVNWRGTVIGKTSNFDFSKGIVFDEFVSDENGKAKNLIKHHKCKNEEEIEVTKIAQGAIEINGAMYTFYESIRKWGEAGYWTVNYSAALKSVDGGKTWQRLYDLIWTGEIEGYEDLVTRLANEDSDMNPGDNGVDIHHHYCPAFEQIYPLMGKDGYAYIYGRRGGRQYGVVVARVKKEDFENFDSYEYYVSINGVRKWIKGVEGMKALNQHEQESYILPLPCSNITIAYNAYLNKYIAVHYKPNVGVVFKMSDNIYGPFENEQLLIKQDDEHLVKHTPKSIYGGFTHELMSKDGGKTFYFIISQWNKECYLSELFEVCLK